jgi:small subunit ribosomal protein S3
MKNRRIIVCNNTNINYIMGHRVQAIGFRIGLQTNWKDIWAFPQKDYSNYLLQSELVKQYLTGVLKKFYILVNACTVHKVFDKLLITIHFYKFAAVRKGSLRININIEFLRAYIEKLTGQQVFFKLINLNQYVTVSHKISKRLFFFKRRNYFTNIINLMRITSMTHNPTALALYIGNQCKKLKKRNNFNNFINFIKIVFQTFVGPNSKLRGLKMSISGALGGVDRATATTFSFGTVPLNTIKASIGYTYQIAYTKYGTFGIKIWLHSY